MVSTILALLTIVVSRGILMGHPTTWGWGWASGVVTSTLLRGHPPGRHHWHTTMLAMLATLWATLTALWHVHETGIKMRRERVRTASSVIHTATTSSTIQWSTSELAARMLSTALDSANIGIIQHGC